MNRLQASCAVILVGLTGCAGEPYPLAPVSGMVTLNGQPLPKARVGFEPMRTGEGLNAGPGSYAETDDEGRFTLISLQQEEGAVVGKHRVWIRTLRAEQGPNGEMRIVAPERLPARYHDQTELIFETPAAGTDQANFELTSP